MNIEQVFLNTRTIFEKQAAEAVEQALDKIYTEYLPHVESDTQANVYFQCHDWLYRFFADKLREEDFKVDMLGYQSEAARELMYQKHKEEITQAIGKDLQEKITRLENQLKEAYRRY